METKGFYMSTELAVGAEVQALIYPGIEVLGVVAGFDGTLVRVRVTKVLDRSGFPAAAAPGVDKEYLTPKLFVTSTL